MDCAFIDDGYTRKSKIRGVAGLYPDVTFAWRPTTIRMRATYYDFIDRVGDQLHKEERGAECMAKQILEWDIKDRHGNVVPINVKSAMGLHPKLFNRLYAVVIGMSEPPDEEIGDEDWQKAELQAVVANESLDEYLEKN